MLNENHICPICGEPTYLVYGKNPRKDRLCGKHAKMLLKGEITISKNGEIFYPFFPEEKETPNIAEVHTECIICGHESFGKDVCKACYSEILTTQNDLDKNKKKWELKDYYYTLRAFIGRLKSPEEITRNVYKLFAIAWLLKTLYKDEQVSDVVNEDAKRLLKIREQLKKIKTNENQKQNDKTIIAVADIEKNRASDGHICKSDAEVIIDDILYKSNICHAYERKVKEIPPSDERTVIADWFIPIKGTDGIYIEYWGMDKKDYQDNKEEKSVLYEKYKIKLIEINKNDVKDRQNLEDHIYQELKRLGWEG